MRNPELLWNPESMARALDVPRDRLMDFVRLELVPPAVVLKDDALWRAADIRAWAKSLGTANPAQAVACLWAQWQDEEWAALSETVRGAHP